VPPRNFTHELAVTVLNATKGGNRVTGGGLARGQKGSYDCVQVFL